MEKVLAFADKQNRILLIEEGRHLFTDCVRN